MVVLITYHHKQIPEVLTTESAFWKHSPDSLLNNGFGLLVHQVFDSLKALSTWITRVTYIFLISQLFTCHLHLLCIDHNDIVPAIHVWSETWLMLSPEDICYS